MSGTIPESTVQSMFQSTLDDAVAKGVAPGFQFIVFTRDKFLFNGVSGLDSIPSAEHPTGRPFTSSTLLWTASCTKICISLIVFHILEHGLAKTGISLVDLDNHDALVEVLPEFKHGSGSLVTKIIEGFEEKLGADGKKVMKVRDAQRKVTLRMLLTHTAGVGYAWNDFKLAQLYRPSDGSVPNNEMAAASGAIRDFEVPLVCEPGTAYRYGFSTDWLGQFVIRATNRNLRELFKEIIFEPLGIPSSEADLWLSPTLSQSRAEIHVRDPGSSSGFRQVPPWLYTVEHEPPKGKAYVAESGLFASSQAYARILQAVLCEDPRILSKQVWQLVVKDDLTSRSIKVERPVWKTAMSDLTFDVDQFSRSTTEDGIGVNLLQCHVAITPTVSGRPAGSFAWGGLANTYYFVDQTTGIGATLGTQLIPFYDAQVVELRDKLERLIYEIVTTFTV